MTEEEREPLIKELEENYCKAANALTDYRSKHGFEPGTKVMARYREEPEKKGIIAPYGDAWSMVKHISVPVLLDSGVLQPWSMSNLTVIAEDAALGQPLNETEEI